MARTEWINSFFERVSFTSKVCQKRFSSSNGRSRKTLETVARRETGLIQLWVKSAITMEFLRKWTGYECFFLFFFSTLAFPLFAEEKNRGGFEGLSGILTSRRKGEGRKLTKKRLEWWNCRVILIIKSWRWKAIEIKFKQFRKRWRRFKSCLIIYNLCLPLWKWDEIVELL